MAARDRLLKKVLGLNERMISLREEVVKTLYTSEKVLQTELLTLARAESKVGKGTK